MKRIATWFAVCIGMVLVAVQVMGAAFHQAILFWITLLSVLFAGPVPPAHAATSFVQGTSGLSFSANTAVANWGSNTTTGNLLACQVWWEDNTSTISSVVDSVGGALTDSGLGVQRLNSAHSAQMFYKENNTGGTTPNVTATFAAAATPSKSSIMCHEVSGRATSGALDQKQWNTQNFTGNGTDFITSGSVTTTTNGQYIFGATHGQFGDVPTAGTNYTMGPAGSVNHTYGEYLTNDQTSAGSIAATFSVASGTDGWITGIMTFKAPASGGGDYFYRRR